MVYNLHNQPPEPMTLLISSPILLCLAYMAPDVPATLLVLEGARDAPVSEFPHSSQPAWNVLPPDICLALS